MSDLELPTVITAIASATTEGFIASTLFAQGWSVVFRAIDIDSLENFIHHNSERAETAMLIFAPDLLGLTRERIDEITLRVKQVVGFSETDRKSVV